MPQARRTSPRHCMLQSWCTCEGTSAQRRRSSLAPCQACAPCACAYQLEHGWQMIPVSLSTSPKRETQHPIKVKLAEDGVPAPASARHVVDPQVGQRGDDAERRSKCGDRCDAQEDRRGPSWRCANGASAACAGAQQTQQEHQQRQQLRDRQLPQQSREHESANFVLNSIDFGLTSTNVD